MKIFVDNDLILDVLLERKEFHYSRMVLEAIESKKVKAYTSPIIFTNTFYLVSKVKDKKTAWEALRKLRILFNVSKVDTEVLDKALASRFLDFEDAIQFYAAIKDNVDYLITRNKKDYIEKEGFIISPKEFSVILDIPK